MFLNQKKPGILFYFFIPLFFSLFIYSKKPAFSIKYRAFEVCIKMDTATKTECYSATNLVVINLGEEYLDIYTEIEGHYEILDFHSRYKENNDLVFDIEATRNGDPKRKLQIFSLNIFGKPQSKEVATLSMLINGGALFYKLENINALD